MDSHLTKLPTDVTKILSNIFNNKIYLVYLSYPESDDPASGYEHIEDRLLGVFNNLNDSVRLLLKFLYTGKEKNIFENDKWTYPYSQPSRGVLSIDQHHLSIREVFMNCEFEPFEDEKDKSNYYQIVGNKLLKTRNTQYRYVLSDYRNFAKDRWEENRMNPSPSLAHAEEVNVNIPEFTIFEFAKKDYNKYEDGLSNWLKIVRDRKM